MSALPLGDCRPDAVTCPLGFHLIGFCQLHKLRRRAPSEIAGNGRLCDVHVGHAAVASPAVAASVGRREVVLVIRRSAQADRHKLVNLSGLRMPGWQAVVDRTAANPARVPSCYHRGACGLAARPVGGPDIFSLSQGPASTYFSFIPIYPISRVTIRKSGIIHHFGYLHNTNTKARTQETWREVTPERICGRLGRDYGTAARRRRQARRRHP